jgi:type II secretory pathway pseudopilin PulG
MKSTKHTAGQVLLIAIMLVAVAVTVVLTISFTSKTDTQISKLEEESQKALAGAEAGIEYALKNGNANLATDIPSLNGITGNASVSNTSGPSFEITNVGKDRAVTFYLSRYDDTLSPPFAGGSQNADVVLCFASTSDTPALDIALIKDSSANPNMYRHAVDPNGQIINAETTGLGSKSASSIDPNCPSKYNYSFVIQNTEVGVNSRLLFVRLLFFGGSNPTSDIMIYQNNLPTQGKIITSTATTKSNVTKKVELIQNSPQLPSDLFTVIF